VRRDATTLRSITKAAVRTAVVAALAVAASLVLGACASLSFGVEGATPHPVCPAATFAVFSDPHLFLPDLGVGEPAFERIKFEDRKLFEYSPSLLDAVIGRIREARPDFVLVPGDLSKDGEEAVHVAVAKALETLRADGIRVYVVPGNHDVNNPGAVRYEGTAAVRVPNVTPERFAEIYRNFGYGDAIERDPGSLAYVVEPVPGLWLLAMDACRYDLNFNRRREYTGGSLTQERLAWLRKTLERARTEGKAVIAMMHHGVVEHFPGQKKQFPEYVVADNDAFSRMLADYGVRVVFTGHFHSQNIAATWWGSDGSPSVPPTGRFIYDIETGSLVTYPCPWRLVKIEPDQVMRVRSFRIESIPEMPTGFPEFAADYSRAGMIPYIKHVLEGYGVSKEEADRIAASVTQAALAHYAGDPKFEGTEMYPTSGLSLMGGIAMQMKKDIIEGMWKGNPPHADNNIDINLADGTYARAD
jgi:Calcineurin-like phosphoesterase